MRRGGLGRFGGGWARGRRVTTNLTREGFGLCHVDVGDDGGWLRLLEDARDPEVTGGGGCDGFERVFARMDAVHVAVGGHGEGDVVICSGV